MLVEEEFVIWNVKFLIFDEAANCNYGLVFGSLEHCAKEFSAFFLRSATVCNLGGKILNNS